MKTFLETNKNRFVKSIASEVLTFVSELNIDSTEVSNVLHEYANRKVSSMIDTLMFVIESEPKLTYVDEVVAVLEHTDVVVETISEDVFMSADVVVTKVMPANVKKVYEPLMQLLLDNQDMKVSTLMPALVKLMQAKKGGSDTGKTFLKDDEGNVIAVFCYYHKKWELVEHVAYGLKANTATGLNTMCKEGTSAWSKQQRDFKKAKESLLMQVCEGLLSGEELPEQMELAEEGRKLIVEGSLQEYNFASMDELQDYLS